MNTTITRRARFCAPALFKHDVTIEGTLRYRHLKGMDCGLFTDLTSLCQAFPTPAVGMYALVVHPDDTSLFLLYGCRQQGEWTLLRSDAKLDMLDVGLYQQTLDILDRLAHAGQALSGFVVLPEVAQLPDKPLTPTTAYLIGGHLYLYVGKGGDTAEGRYHDCGPLRGATGAEGAPGRDGLDAVVLDGVNLFSSTSAIDTMTDGQKETCVPDAKVIEEVGNAMAESAAALRKDLLPGDPFSASTEGRLSPAYGGYNIRAADTAVTAQTGSSATSYKVRWMAEKVDKGSVVHFHWETASSGMAVGAAFAPVNPTEYYDGNGNSALGLPVAGFVSHGGTAADGVYVYDFDAVAPHDGWLVFRYYTTGSTWSRMAFTVYRPGGLRTEVEGLRADVDALGAQGALAVRVASDLYSGRVVRVASVASRVVTADGQLYTSGSIPSYSHSGKIKLTGRTVIDWSGLPQDGPVSVRVAVFSSPSALVTSPATPPDFLPGESMAAASSVPGSFTVDASADSPRWVVLTVQLPYYTGADRPADAAGLLDRYNEWVRITSSVPDVVRLSDRSRLYPCASVSQFERIAVVGDSWSSGYVYCGASRTLRRDVRRLSWIANLARRNGVRWYNFAVGGATVASWLGKAEGHRNDSVGGLSALLSAPVCDLYLIWWGANEVSHGESYPIGSMADIDMEDYTRNADTFYGNTARCLQAILRKAAESGADARVVWMGPKTAGTKTGSTVADGDLYGPRIEIARAFGIPLMTVGDDAWYGGEFQSRRDAGALPGGHPDVMDQTGIAMAVERAFAECVEENRDYFSRYYREDAFAG